MAEEGPEVDEVERAKSYLAGVARIRLQTNGAVASEIMENYVYGLGLDFTERLLESVRLVTADDLREVAKTHLSGDNCTIATLRGSIGREDG